jgi:hypothetical protein
MIVAWIVSLGGDLLVTGLVKTTFVVGRCNSGTGVICAPPPNNLSSIPDRQMAAVVLHIGLESLGSDR